ncbi:MAG: hypothetical protein DIU52_012440 [bacterium]
MERTVGFARILGLAVLPCFLAACGPSSDVRQQLAQLEAVSAEKDSLLLQVAENARLMSDIAAEIARVQTPRTATVGGQEPTPIAITRENLLENIQQLTARLEESEKRLAESEQRIRTLTRESQSAQARLAEFRKTIQGLQATIENQKQTIAMLTEQVNALQEENVRLAEENRQLALEKSALEQTLSEIEERESTVYYVVGTKEELLRRGLVTEEGGSRVLFIFGKRGKTLVPSRVLDLTQFTAVDKRVWTEFQLPRPDKEYRIITRQDLSALAEPADEEGKIRGALRIADPDRFWAHQKYLILVES